MADDPQDRPDYGPSGYLPERASKRARKIVLRAPLGLQWVVASVIAGVIVVAAGVLFLTRSAAPPGDPWVEVGALDDVAGEVAGLHHLGIDGVLVAVAGRVRVFAAVGDLDLHYCAESRRLEAPDGRVWSLTGRGLNDLPSLDEHPVLVRDAVVYVDPTRITPGPAPSREAADPACV